MSWAFGQNQLLGSRTEHSVLLSTAMPMCQKAVKEYSMLKKLYKAEKESKTRTPKV